MQNQPTDRSAEMADAVRGVTASATANPAPAALPPHHHIALLLGAICATLAVAGVAAGVALGVVAAQHRETVAAVAAVERTQEVIAAVEQILAGVLHAETDTRAFLLTGDATYLAPAGHASEAIWRSFAEARRFGADNPHRVADLQGLAGLVQDELALGDRLIALARTGDARGAVANLAEGTRMTDAIRRATEDMVAEEQKLIQERRARRERLQQSTMHILIGLTAAATGGVLLLGLAFARARAAATARNRAAAAAAAERQRLLGMMDLAAILVRDLDGTIRFWSEGCRQLYGWTADQVLGRSSHALLQTEFPVPLVDIEVALARHGEWSGDLRQRTRDGSEVIVAARKVLQLGADRRGVELMENVTDVTALRRAEAALRESQARLDAVVETAAEGIVVAEGDGRIISVNRAALHMFGYDSADELIGRDVGVLMPPADRERHHGHVAALKAGARPRMVGVPGRELTAIHRDGSEFPVDLSMTSFGSNGQSYLTGIIRDATARREAEAALRDSEARMRLVAQVGGIAATDRRIGEDAALISGEYIQLYGLPHGQTHITVAAWHDLMHPDDRDLVEAGLRNVRDCGDTLACEFRIYRPDGALRWVAMRAEAFLGHDGRPVRVVTAQQDITDIVAAREAQAARQEELERAVAERTAALAEAKARFRGIFDSQFAFIGLLAPDGAILEVNRTALEAGGLTRDEVIGRRFWETPWFPAGERDQLRQDLEAAAKGGLVRRDMENQVAGGGMIWVDFSLKPVHDPATGKLMWVIAEGRDLTEKRVLAGKLAQAQKVQALGQLASGIAHDFNNILQAVSGAAMLIERRPEDHDRTRRLAHTAIDAAARGASITQRLLSFVRRGEVRTDVIAIAELLASVREVLAHTLGTGITVRDVVPSAVPPVMADRGQLETALVNLGTNARDAMRDGGTLTLAAAAEHVAAGDRHPAGLAPGDYVRLSVADTGTGMDAATLARTTEAFFTTKPPGEGTGLGLAMVKSFAEQSGGALSIVSTQGVGTTVVFWLRQAVADAARTPPDEAAGRVTVAAPSRVLLVDDDDLVRETLAAQLEDAGFATLVAANGTEALALIEAGEVINALVSDLSMPGLNGVVTIQRARALRPGLPCFLLTGYVGERAALAADDAFTLVRKPVGGRLLAARIEAALEAGRTTRTVLDQVHGRR